MGGDETHSRLLKFRLGFVEKGLTLPRMRVDDKHGFAGNWFRYHTGTTRQGATVSNALSTGKTGR